MNSDRKQIGPLFRERKFEELRAMYNSNPSLFEGIQELLFDSAINRVDYDALQFILDIGYDINEVSYTGTPLSRASSGGSVDLIKWLIDRGAQPDTSTISTNPLFSAIQGGNLELVKYFLAEGIDTKKKYPCGRNALDFARIWNNQNIIAELGGDPNWKRSPWVACNIKDFSGQRPCQEMFDAVELELKCKIPEIFKEFLVKKLPDDLFFSEVKDNDDWIWLGKDHQLFHTARSMIAYNSIDPEQEDKTLKYESYFVIGTDGGGNDYCLITNSNKNNIWIHDHETEEFEDTNLSLEELSKELINE